MADAKAMVKKQEIAKDESLVGLMGHGTPRGRRGRDRAERADAQAKKEESKTGSAEPPPAGGTPPTGV